jgi:hypothetical protein
MILMKKFCFYWNAFNLFKKFLNRKAIATAFLIATLPILANAQTTPIEVDVATDGLSLGNYTTTSVIHLTSDGSTTTSFGVAGDSTNSDGQSFTIGGWDSSVNLGGGGRCR